MSARRCRAESVRLNRQGKRARTRLAPHRPQLSDERAPPAFPAKLKMRAAYRRQIAMMNKRRQFISQRGAARAPDTSACLPPHNQAGAEVGLKTECLVSLASRRKHPAASWRRQVLSRQVQHGREAPGAFSTTLAILAFQEEREISAPTWTLSDGAHTSDACSPVVTIHQDAPPGACCSLTLSALAARSTAHNDVNVMPLG